MSNRDDATLIPAAAPSPLLGPAVALCVAIGLADEFPGQVRFLAGLGLAAAAIACGVSVFARRDERLGTMALTAALLALAFTLGVARYEDVTVLPANHVGKLVADDPILTRISGVIVRPPMAQPAVKRNLFLPFDPAPRVRLVLAAEALETTPQPQPITGLVQLSVQVDHLALRPGDRIRCTGRLYRLKGAQNPGETDWARINQLDGIYVGMFVEEPELVEKLEPAGGGRLRALAWLQDRARQALLESYAGPDEDEGRGLLDAMILGQRDAVSRSLNEAFIRTGTIHVLSVSGFHFALLAGSVYWLARMARRSPPVAALITLPVILLFALVAEPNAPLLRSALISVLICASQLTRRRPAPLNWLAFAAIALLLWNPLQFFQPGFQLSFVQVAALMLTVPAAQWLVKRPVDPLEPRQDLERLRPILLRKFARGLGAALLISTVLWFVSLPLVLYHFGRFSLWAIPQTVILTPLVEFVTLAGFATELFGLVASPVANLCGYVLTAATRLLVWAVHLLAQMPGSLIATDHPPAGLVVLTCGVLLLIPFFRHQASPRGVSRPWRRGVRGAALATSVVLSAFWLAWQFLPARHAAPQLTVLAVGNGSAAILTDSRGTAVVLDVGTTRNSDAGQVTADALRANHVHHLAELLLSHADFDHFSGVPTLLAAASADEVISTDSFATKMARAGHMRPLAESFQRAGRRPQRAVLGDILRAGELRLDVLWPPAELPRATPDNDTSLVLAVNLGETRVLIPGDIADGAMEGLLEYAAEGILDLKADVLIAPHHGSTTARHVAEFYRAVGPRVVIVSSATPRPKLETLVRQSVGQTCHVLTTCRSGAITIGPKLELRDGRGFRVEPK